MSHVPRPEPASRESSFVRSFYQTTDNATGADALGTVPQFHASPPRSPMSSARRQGVPRFQASPPRSPIPSARLQVYHQSRESTGKIPSSLNDLAEIERNNGEILVDHVLNPKKPASVDNTQTLRNIIPVEENGFGVFDDKEVLEQYRIMAQHEASIRVKENCGFDILEYEKRRKLISSEQASHQELYRSGTQPKIKLPPPKPVLATAIPTLKPEEPPMPPAATSWSASKFLDPRIHQPRDPDLGMGTSVRGGATIPHDEHVVRCLGCRGQLRVKLTATLVKCPECSTVSPASSTRR
jgi:hypothetical protein